MLFEQFKPGLYIHDAADAISHAKGLSLSLGYGRLDVAQAVAEVATIVATDKDGRAPLICKMI